MRQRPTCLTLWATSTTGCLSGRLTHQQHKTGEQGGCYGLERRLITRSTEDNECCSFLVCSLLAARTSKEVGVTVGV